MSCTNILRVLGKLGAGADVVSGGELLKALKAGIKPKKIAPFPLTFCPR